MTKEDSLRIQVKSRFIDYLKIAALPYWEPELTICPHCGEYASIIMDCMWSCPHCNRHGDVVDYVREAEHLESTMAAIKRICRTLQIKVTTLDVISATDLMDRLYKNTEPLVENLIGRGVCLMAGPPKVGKSWLVLWLAHSICLGEDVWDFKTRQCDVLYISLEDPERRIQSRLAEITHGETGKLWFATEAELMGKGFEEQLTGFLVDNPTVKFVIVDTLQKVRQVRASQYSYAGDYEVISHMKSIADRFGITILLVHHTRKAGATDPFAMISGTSGLLGGVDGALVLLKDDRMEDRAKLYVTGRDVLDMELELMFDKDTARWKFLGYGVKERIQKRGQLLDEVNAYLAEVGSFQGSASQLLTQLSLRTDLKIKSANALTRLLNPHKNLLQYEYGILYENDRSGKERTLRLTKLPDDDCDDIVPADNETVIIVT